MSAAIYCWRCQMVIPMLDEHEWQIVAPLLREAIRDVVTYRNEHQCSLAEAKEISYGHKALAEYKNLTGFAETNADALYHHRASMYGPPCHACGKPLRMPRASFCAACGAAPL